MNRVFVTGGAGFIGSHLVDALLARGSKVTAFDDLSTGSRAFLASALASPAFTLVEGDHLDRAKLAEAMRGHDLVFHLSADPDVRTSGNRAEKHLEQNVIATTRVLEAMRDAGVLRIGFTSTSTVYGEARTIPTPEDYAPLEPISLYGASKLASEAVIGAFCHSFGFRGVAYRFANVVGPRSNHGVTFDFYHKLKRDAKRLEILGDGRQSKSYCHVADVVEAMLLAWERPLSEAPFEAVNVGSEDAIDVTSLAREVVTALGLADVEFAYTGGVDGGRGWKGDVKTMRLSVEKMKRASWRPRYGSAASIRATAEALRDAEVSR